MCVFFCYKEIFIRFFIGISFDLFMLLGLQISFESNATIRVGWFLL